VSIIAVVGSLNVDLVIRAPRQPFLGETLIGRSFGTTGGGKGSNQALACARLGAESHIIGCVGNDDFGVRLRSTLVAGKVNCEHLEISGAAGTGVAVVTVLDQGDNTIILAPGANACLDAKAVERSAEVFKKADAALFQLEVPLTAVEAGLALARTTGCQTVLTPAPAQALPSTIWPLIDYLILNEKELAFYAAEISGSGAAKNGTAAGGSGSTGDLGLDAVKRAAKRLLVAGVKGVVVTHGAQGGVVVTKQADFFYPPFAVEAVDFTGAGDAFCAALSVGLSDGMSIAQAARFASAAGALACTRFGAHPSLPWRHEVEALLELAPPVERTQLEQAQLELGGNRRV
jgi:ribokinase